MNRVRAGLLGLLTTPSFVLVGCGYFHPKPTIQTDPDLNFYQTAVTQLEFVDEVPPNEQAISTPAPLNLETDTPDFREISLQECIQLALKNNEVMRDLGGVVFENARGTSDGLQPGSARIRTAIGFGSGRPRSRPRARLTPNSPRMRSCSGSINPTTTAR